LPAGAIEASRRLGIPVSRVARTTNRLEFFNGRINGKYLKPFQHSGRLPRIDTWVFIVITTVIPDFFKERRDRIQLKDLYAVLRVLNLPAAANSSISGSIPQDISWSAQSSSEAPENPVNALILEWLNDLESSLDGDDSGSSFSGDDSISGDNEHGLSPHSDSGEPHPLFDKELSFDQEISSREQPEQVSTSMAFDELSIPAIPYSFLEVCGSI